MKNFNRLISSLLVFTLLNSINVYAKAGDFGYFGGISEGRTLPKTTTQLLSKNNKIENLETTYKEMLFLDGKPIEFEGQIKIVNGEKITGNTGKYNITYTITPGTTTDTNASLNRNLKYDVKYRKEGNQTIKNFDVSTWRETMTIRGANYTLDPKQSKSSISIIEDNSPGVTYYRGDISHLGTYSDGQDGTVTLEMIGQIYGYESAWSSVETQVLDCTISTKDWQMQYQIRPSVGIGKTLQYGQNLPTAISFSGVYKEVMQNKSGLNYNINLLPTKFNSTVNKTGSTNVRTFNTFEQLLAPDLSYIKGHFAEEDIKKLFSMEVLSGDPTLYNPSQAITRGQFIQMLVKSIKLPITKVDNSNKNKTTLDIVFPDVRPERIEYPYIMSAYNAGLAYGKEDGTFKIDEPIQRQEAIVVLIRTLGLSNIGLEQSALTSFTDDSKIDLWAKKEIAAANKLEIITGDTNGKFNPKKNVTKAEAAAFINRLINYMRTDLQTDYIEHIVNYKN